MPDVRSLPLLGRWAPCSPPLLRLRAEPGVGVCSVGRPVGILACPARPHPSIAWCGWLGEPRPASGGWSVGPHAALADRHTKTWPLEERGPGIRGHPVEDMVAGWWGLLQDLDLLGLLLLDLSKADGQDAIL